MSHLPMLKMVIFLLVCWHTISLTQKNRLTGTTTGYVIDSGENDSSKCTFSHGAIVRGDSTKKQLAFVFTADEFGEGLPIIYQALAKQKVKAGFFFTGRFYRNKKFQPLIKQLYRAGHYMGPHSDQHLLYCDWNKRDSLLITKEVFRNDIRKNMDAIEVLGINPGKPQFFIPPYEWWNDSIAIWSRAEGLTLVNFTPGIRTNADYTYPDMGSSYKSSEWIMNWLKEFSNTHPKKLQGSIILIHAGTDPHRKDKLYYRLHELINDLKSKNYQFKRIDELCKAK